MPRARFSMDKKNGGLLEAKLTRILADKVEQGSISLRKIGEDIMEESLQEVPRHTNTLANSAFIEVKRGGTTTIGYGGPNDQTNPISGEKASEYMMYVHEDLEAVHPIGKAKFFEDPLRKAIARVEEVLANDMRRGNK